jgi:hypothetical protein
MCHAVGRHLKREQDDRDPERHPDGPRRQVGQLLAKGQLVFHLEHGQFQLLDFRLDLGPML